LEGTQLPKLKRPQRLLFEDRSRLELRQPGFIEARTGGTARAEFNMYPVLFKDSDSNPAYPVLGYRDLSSGVGLDRSFGPLFTSLFYNFQTSFPFTYHGELAAGFKRIMLSYLDLVANLDFRNNAIHPHEGVFFGNDLQLAKNPFIGAGDGTLLTNDWRIQSEVRGYVPITRRITLAARAMVGFLFPSSYVDNEQSYSTDDVQQVYFRGFFSGGTNSNRGYAYRDIGPKEIARFLLSGTDGPTVNACTMGGGLNSDECTTALKAYCAAHADTLVCEFPTGGLSVWEASIEVRFPIAHDFEGAVFCDASDVSKRGLNLRWLYPHLSCGVGLHYDTPVGPLRLDVGYQIPKLQVPKDSNEQPVGSPFAISIGIGEAF
jgi:outer membrane protein insertion porin family/translocation and assembly module TamA